MVENGASVFLLEVMEIIETGGFVEANRENHTCFQIGFLMDI